MLQRVVLAHLLVIIAACGSSRSTRTTNCSNLKTIADKRVPVGSQVETYDPTAVLLLFKATSDKLTIESRCNAKLMNKMSVRQKDASGQWADVVAPIDFKQLQVQMESGEANLELHTSAHCFYRVWDSRVSNQVKNNPQLGIEPVRSLLRDLKTRYQLYRSMLTTPQTIVAYLPDGAPVSFSYKLTIAAAFENFFAEVDKLKSPTMETVVGRELSKSSVILDEFVLDECNSDEKIVSQIGPDDAARAGVTSAFQLAEFLKKYDSGSAGNKMFSDLLRTRMLATGRHKLCFSQADLVVAPITLTEKSTTVQKSLLAEIEQTQQKRIDSYLAELNKTNGHRFIPEITAVTTALPTPAGVQSCSFSDKYPGFSITDSFYQILGTRYAPNWLLIDAVQPEAHGDVIGYIFPKLVVDPLSTQFLKSTALELLKEPVCTAGGYIFDDKTRTCTTQPNLKHGRCPLAATAEEEIKTAHDAINSSLRLAATSPLHNLKKYRESSALALSTPFASLWDFVLNACNSEQTESCEQSKKLKSVLDSIANKHWSKVESSSTAAMAKDITTFYDNLKVTAIDKDLQFLCDTMKFDQKNTQIRPDFSSRLFNLFSRDAQSIVSEGLDSGYHSRYVNSAVRFLYLKCISAGSQRLYSGLDSVAGLFHGIGFDEVSFVQTDQSSSHSITRLTNSEMAAAGRPIKVPFAGLFFGGALEQMVSSEIPARIIGAPHLQISDCKSRADTAFCRSVGTKIEDLPDPSTLTSQLQDFKAHLTFTTMVPNWLPEAEKVKYGHVAFPPANYSAESARYYFSAGDSGTTVSHFGLFPLFMLSTVQDRPVSGGLAVIPSTGGQEVQSSKNTTCR